MNPSHKPLVWLFGEIHSPPFSKEARIEAGFLLRLLQMGEKLSMPHSRPMPVIGPRCHELRINDARANWRIMYRIDGDAVIIADIFDKKRSQTPQEKIRLCQNRLRRYDELTEGN